MNMQKTIGVVVAIIASLILITYLFLQSRATLNLFGKKPTATVNTHTISLTLARTEKEKQIGLSETPSLQKNSGMLFLFDTADTYGFWMKNMKYPIDIIFINDSKIITIFKNVTPPPTDSAIPDEKLPIYTPASPSNRVLEIPGGMSDTYSLKVGDNVEFTL